MTIAGNLSVAGIWMNFLGRNRIDKRTSFRKLSGVYSSEAGKFIEVIRR